MGSASLARNLLDSVCCALSSWRTLNSSKRTNCPDPDAPDLAWLFLTPFPHNRGLSLPGRHAYKAQGKATGVSAQKHSVSAARTAQDRRVMRAESRGVCASRRVPLQPLSRQQSLPFTVPFQWGPPLKCHCLPRGPREAKQLPSHGACKIFNKGQGTIDP